LQPPVRFSPCTPPAKNLFRKYSNYAKNYRLKVTVSQTLFSFNFLAFSYFLKIKTAKFARQTTSFLLFFLSEKQQKFCRIASQYCKTVALQFLKIAGTKLCPLFFG